MDLKLMTPRSLQEVREYAQQFGQYNHPFLSAQYSSGTRVPSIDLTPFITQWLRSGNINLIEELMMEVLAGNPGLGGGPGWIRKEIEKAAKLPFHQFIQFADEKDYDELRALWIMAIKDGSGSQFWINGEIPTIFSYALASLLPTINKSIYELVEKANRFISDMGKIDVNWRNYPLFDFNEISFEPIPETKVTRIIRKMPISTRLHLFFAVKAGGGSLPKLTNFAIRNFGIVVSETTQQLINSFLFLPTSDIDTFSISMSKEELFAIYTSAGIESKKSWNKNKLTYTLKEKNPDLFEGIARKESIVIINPEYKDHLEALYEHSKLLISFLKVLCFI
jgi:hypothetical protein